MDSGEGYSLTQNAGLVGISKFVNILGLLAASMILTRLLSRSEYGNYEQVWLVYNSLLPLAAYGLSSSVYYFSAREGRPAVYSAAVAVSAIVACLPGNTCDLRAVDCDLVRIRFADCLHQDSRGIYGPVGALTDVRIGLRDRKKSRPPFSGEYYHHCPVCTFSLSIGSCFHNLTIVFISIACVGAIKSIYLLWFMVRAHRMSLRHISPVMKAQVLYSLPIIASTIAGTISKQVDRYLVSILMTPEKFAVYAIGAKELPLIAVITGSASAILFPSSASWGPAKAGEVHRDLE